MRQAGESRIRRLKRDAGRWLFRAMGRVYRRMASGEPPPLRSEAIRRVVIVNLLRIGDTVVATPAIHAIRDAFPRAHLTLVVQSGIRSLLAADPAIDEFMAPRMRLRGHEFDLAVVLDMSFRANLIAWSIRAPRRVGYDSFDRGFLLTDRVPAPSYWNTAVYEYPPDTEIRHQVDSWLHLVEQMGIQPRDRRPRLYVSDDAQNRARSFIADSGTEPGEARVALHPSSSPSYQWRTERFAGLADALVDQHNAKVFVTGSPADGALAKHIAGKMSASLVDATGAGGLDFLTALLAEMDLVIGVDTCAGHIASAVGTPAIVLFGPGDPQIWRPYGAGHTVIRDERSECLGCKRASCFREAHFCMDGITVESVLAAAGRKLRSRRSAGRAP